MRRAAWLAATLCWGCGYLGVDELPVADAGGSDSAVEAGDAGTDSGTDAGTDSGTDAGTDSGTDAGPPPPGDFCENVTLLASAPSIDGVLEAGLTLRRAPREGWSSSEPLPADHLADYALAYRPDGVYFFVHVIDDTRLPAELADPDWCGDGVEIYLDSDGMFPDAPNYDVPGTIQFIVSPPVDDTTVATRGSRWNNVSGYQGVWSSVQYAAFPTPDGYTVEAMMVAADMDLASWMPTAGTSIGLSFSINVAVLANDPNAGCGHRLGQYFNRLAMVPNGGCGRGAYCTTDAFCVAPLQP